MDVTSFTQMISTVGFPIACCIAIFWYMTKESENHKVEVNGLKDALNANTVVLTELKQMIADMRGEE